MINKKLYRLQRRNALLVTKAAIINRNGVVTILRLLVDTGSSYTIRRLKSLEDLGCNINQPQSTTAIVTASGVINSPVVAVPFFNCLGKRIENFSVVAYTVPARAFVDGLLGMDFLNRYQAVISVGIPEIQLD